MGDSLRSSLNERDIEQVITALKKGSALLKYGRRARPKISPFRLSNDESSLICIQERRRDILNLIKY